MPDNPTPTLAKDIDELLLPFHSHSCHSSQAWIKGQTAPFPCDCDLLEARTALLKRFEAVMLEVIGSDFDVSKIPFGSAQIEAIVANRLKEELRQRLTAVLSGEEEQHGDSKSL